MSGNIYITFNSGCGCGGQPGEGGEGGGTGDTPTSPIPGIGTGGGWPDGIVTLLDFCTTVVPLIIDDVDDFMGRISDGTFWAGLGSAVVAPFIRGLVDSLKESADDVQAALIDPDVIRKIKKVTVQHFSDPVGAITRAQLRSFAYKMPLTMEGAPLWAAFVIWAEVVDLDTLNESWIPSASGTGVPTSECGALFTEVGRPIYVPGTGGSGGGGTICESFDFTADDGGFVIADDLQGYQNGQYTPGVGWQTEWHEPTGKNASNTLTIRKNNASAIEVTRIDGTFALDHVIDRQFWIELMFGNTVAYALNLANDTDGVFEALLTEPVIANAVRVRVIAGEVTEPAQAMLTLQTLELTCSS